MATQTQTTDEKTIPNGLAAAALLAGGIGAFFMGLITTLAEASVPLANTLKFVAPVGPLSGKTIVTVIVWLVSWVILGNVWKGKDVNFSKIAVAAFVLLALGILGTFPPFFELFIPK